MHRVLNVHQKGKKPNRVEWEVSAGYWYTEGYWNGAIGGQSDFYGIGWLSGIYSICFIIRSYKL